MSGRLVEGKVGPIGRDGDSVMSSEETGVDIDLSEVEELEGHFGEFVLLGGRTNDIGINQVLQLLRSKGRLELKRLAHASLGDGEGSDVGRHCRGLLGSTVID